MKKRVLFLALALVMVLSLLPAPAQAAKGRYDIILDPLDDYSNVNNVKVTVDGRDTLSAAPGDIVTVTTAKFGFYVGSNIFAMGYDSLEPVDITDHKDGTYSFVMPGEDVTVGFQSLDYGTGDCGFLSEPRSVEVGKTVEFVAYAGIDPPYISLDDLSYIVEWESSDTSAAVITPDPDDPFKATLKGIKAGKLYVTVTVRVPLFAEIYGEDVYGEHARDDRLFSMSIVFTVTAPSAPAFTDVKPGAYYTDAVAWAVENKVTTGATDTTFNPGGNCTRAQIVTFLWRAYGSQEPKSMVSPFTDVTDPSSPYYKAILWAVENDITTGATETTFNPGGTCTRGQAVTFLWRAADKPSASGGSAFTDVADGKFYTDAVKWAVENKITEGKTSTTFVPGDTCSRGQIVTFLYRDLA